MLCGIPMQHLISTLLKQSRRGQLGRSVPDGIHLHFPGNKSYADCLRELNWPTLACRHHYYMIDYIQSMFHKRNSLSFDDYFQRNSSTTRSHASSIQPVTSTYRHCFFVNSVGTMYPLIFCLL